LIGHDERVSAHDGTEIPVVVCFDVEPDDRLVARSGQSRWKGFDRMLEVLPGLRRRMSELTGQPVAFSHFLRMDPQIEETFGSPTWLADEYGDALAELQEEGDELGIHTHPWRWDEQRAEWMAEYDDAAWAKQCLDTGLAAFEAGFGRRSTAHRGGDRFLTGEMLSQLEDGGVIVDLSIEPGMPPATSLGVEGELARGHLPDYRDIPAGPYRSSPARFPAPDPVGGGPLLVPLFGAPGKRRMLGRKPLPATRSVSVFKARLAAELLLRTPPVIALAVRSDAALRDDWDTLGTNLEHLARRRGLVFTTASAAAERLDRASQPLN
jgi:hypothetical protein